MTTKFRTQLLSLDAPDAAAPRGSVSDTAYRMVFGAIGWPWLVRSLWGGTKVSKARLLARLDLADDALPHLGSWKADTGFLHRIVDAIETLRPQVVVELGAGASSLVAARALQRNGGGRLVSYDQHAGFVRETAAWLDESGTPADLRHAPLTRTDTGWPGTWYALSGVPERIDLIIIDGPPWTVHPYVRGAADTLFDRLTPGGIVLLDDADRPGERIVARRWRRRWPDIHFARAGGSTKGTLVGRKAADVVRLPLRGDQADRDARRWRPAAAAAILLAFAGGWGVRSVSEDITPPAQAASFIDQAAATQRARALRSDVLPRLATTTRDAEEIARATGIRLPALPAGWAMGDVQFYPAGEGVAVQVALTSDRGEALSLFASRAETPAEDRKPLLAERAGQPIGYWEDGALAYAVTAPLEPARVMALSGMLAGG